jgi:hypothetical protein
MANPEAKKCARKYAPIIATNMTTSASGKVKRQRKETKRDGFPGFARICEFAAICDFYIRFVCMFKAQPVLCVL